MSEFQALKEWVANARRVHPDYSIEEIGELAVAAGFDRITVSMWETSEKFRRAS